MADYEQLKKFVGLYYDMYMVSPQSKPESHPLISLKNLEEKSPADARRGILMAINDIVERSSDWMPQQVYEADALFAKRKTFTLTEVRHRYSRKYSLTLKRGIIKSIQEYYLLKGIVDGGLLEIGSDEFRKIESMLATYEEMILRAN